MYRQIEVNNEVAFIPPAPFFIIGQTTGGYTLQYWDGVESHPWESLADVPADTQWPVSHAYGVKYLRLEGNTDDRVVVNF